jgi:hypothetical protein
MNNEKSYYLRVKTVEPAKEASNGNGSYKKVTFQQMMSEQINATKVIVKPTSLTVTMNLWTAQKRSDGTMSKAHFMYDDVVEGDEWSGSIEKFNTTPYTIEAADGSKREARSLTVVVFEGEVGIDVANAQLSQRNACVVKIDEEGVAHNTVNLDVLRQRNTERAAGNTGSGPLKFNELTQDEIDDLDEQAFIDYNKSLAAAGKPAAKQTA